jgi:DNA-binding protein Fis
MEHALTVVRGSLILTEHLPPIVAKPAAALPPGEAVEGVAEAVRKWAEEHVGDERLAGRVYEELLDAIEPPLLEVALNRHRGQCAAAARTLGIHRTTLRKKLTQHRIDGGTIGE